jgi:hypothetical protein
VADHKLEASPKSWKVLSDVHRLKKISDLTLEAGHKQGSMHHPTALKEEDKKTPPASVRGGETVKSPSGTHKLS